jgi:predicted adenine nucleotide alpha hydrolase (AANH) superfamily ATPase
MTSGIKRSMEVKIVKIEVVRILLKNSFINPTNLAKKTKIDTSFISDAFNVYIIVENSLRIYCYTQSLVKMALLRTFSEPEGLFINYYYGRITHDSCNRAFESGISALTISIFLRQYTNYQLINKTNGPLIKEIAYQIEFWYSEFNKLEIEPSMMLDNFNNGLSFQKAENWALELGVLIWSSSVKQQLIVSSANFDTICSLSALDGFEQVLETQRKYVF